MSKDFFVPLLINTTENLTNSYPLWYFTNDILTIIGNIIGIFVAFLFIFTIIRLDHPSYSISNLIACNTCLAIGLTNTVMLFNACFALKSDFRGMDYSDSFCILRGTLLCIFYIYMYTSLSLKAFNRLRCIVYHTRPVLISNRCLLILILFQWLFAVLLTLLILLTNGINFDWGSHLCLILIRKIYQFIFLKIIYYISILFISSVYAYILYYVLHLPLLERYRRKRQLAVLRRILVLLIMLVLPGFFSPFLFIHWILFGSIPSYLLKISTLLDTISHTGSVITIFVSHTKLLHQYYNRKQMKRRKTIQLESYQLILSRDPILSK